MKKLILIAGMLLFANNTFAQTSCQAMPSCEEFGYIYTASSCEGVSVLKCPFDQTKLFCEPLTIPTCTSSQVYDSGTNTCQDGKTFCAQSSKAFVNGSCASCVSSQIFDTTNKACVDGRVYCAQSSKIFKNGACESCAAGSKFSPTAYTCYIEATQCTRCPNNATYNTTSKKCLCDIGTYYNSTTGQCVIEDSNYAVVAHSSNGATMITADMTTKTEKFAQNGSELYSILTSYCSSKLLTAEQTKTLRSQFGYGSVSRHMCILASNKQTVELSTGGIGTYSDDTTVSDLIGNISDCHQDEKEIGGTAICKKEFSAFAPDCSTPTCGNNEVYNGVECVCSSGYTKNSSGVCVASTTSTTCTSGQIKTAYGCRTPCEVGMYYSGNELECSYSKDTYKIIETSCSGAGIAYLDESAMDPEFRAKDTVVQLVYNTAKNKCGGDKYNLPDETWARMIANSYGVSCIVVRDGIYVNGTIVKDMNLSVDDKGTTAISPCIEGDNIQAYMPCVTYKGAGCI